MALAAEGTFERNTVAVKGALLAVRRAKPDAVIMVAPYAQFIKLARQIKFDRIAPARTALRGLMEDEDIGV